MSHEFENFTKLLKELDEAKRAVVDAERQELQARSRSTEANNRLNAAQKAFDAVV